MAKADFLGRTTEDAKTGEDPSSVWLLEEAHQLAVATSAPEPILLGRHLLDLGYQPGPKMGKLLKKAYEAQLEGDFSDLDGALQWIKNS